MNLSKARKPAQQVWAIGESVKVGFLRLEIIGRANGSWILKNANGKQFSFEPHIGLFAI